MKAADIMTTEVVTIDSSATISQAAKVMKQHNLRSLIVERSSQNDAYGIITLKGRQHLSSLDISMG